MFRVWFFVSVLQKFLLNGGFKNGKIIKLDNMSRVALSLQGVKMTKVIVKVLEKTKNRAYVYDEKLIRKFESEEEEAKKSGFAGDIQVQSKSIGKKRDKKENHYGWDIDSKNRPVSKRCIANNNTQWTTIRVEESGFCNWKSMYVGEEFVDMAYFVHDFVPKSEKQFYGEFKHQYGKEKWWTDELGHYIAKKAEAVHAYEYQWIHDRSTFFKIWDPVRHYPNVEFNNFEDYVGSGKDQIQIYNDCIRPPMRVSDGYMNGNKYVFVFHF